MQDLQLIGVHEDGKHLLLSGADDKRYQMPVDDALRAAVRRSPQRLGQQQIDIDSGLRPRDVQALIRAGASTDEAASRAGWSVEKVGRYEGPILAEREHVAALAQRARLRSRTDFSGGEGATLAVRVTERLTTRDVEVTHASWDSWRTEGNPWTVVLTFDAGGRQRQASWSFDLADRTVTAVDDEARWLSEEVEEAKGPIPAPRRRSTSGPEVMVYDVEAEGGLQPSPHQHADVHADQHPGQQPDQNPDQRGDEHHEEVLDLMTAMRKRSTARSRRRPGRSKGSGASNSPDTQVPDAGVSASEQAPSLLDLDELKDLDGPEKPSDPEGPAKTSEPADDSPARPKRPGRHTAGRRTGRPGVPSWDEIMFGSRPGAKSSSS